MLHRIEVGVSPHLKDVSAKRLLTDIKNALDLDIEDLRIIKVFTLENFSKEQALILLDEAALHDPILHKASLSYLSGDADWFLEVSYRPGVTDNEGRTARDTSALVLNLSRENFNIYAARQYRLWGEFSRTDIEHIAKDLLANELIESFRIKSRKEWIDMPGFAPLAARVSGKANEEVAVIPISSMDDAQMLCLSQKNTWALGTEEMQAIKNYFAREETQQQRKAWGLPNDPLDGEMEVLAQTWSEHCKHRIFAAQIDYEDKENGKKEIINSLYKTYIQDTTAALRQKMGKNDFCRSVFKDNAGVVAFDDAYDVCIKVETHNSPSALDPYGGALTGIVGVNRDPMGTGLGAELICNTDVFCFASPFYDKALPPRLLHPRRVMEGVRQGVEDGGNKSGIPTVNGSIVFDKRYLGKPLVFCGTVGILPHLIMGRPGYEKKANPGDIVVMAGGRIGKDGIHGATFSSEALHEGSPATAVQIGDPITQRKMYDFIIRARDLGLYSSITDNGAGGLSSSVGEMAEDSGGCRIDLDKAPLKYDGLKPWEILLSEAQERMTLAVPKKHLDKLLRLARHMDVQATALGEFTDSGFFYATYGEKTVACLSMDFLHNGAPKLKLKAVWQKEKTEVTQSHINLPDEKQKDMLCTMLGRLNICSKEYIIRQYDHEVQAASVIKPLVGIWGDGPSDAAVIRPLFESNKGLVISHGICPKFSDYDTYDMAANAIDEAVRNAIAVGADPAQMAGVDNFCWCDPIQSENTPNGHYKLAQLVRACKALDYICRTYSLPCVSGKDSMKNDYVGGGQKISIPPTLLFTILGQIPDVNLAVSSDFKRPGDIIYLLGITGKELGGSELANELGIKGLKAPAVNAEEAILRYRAVHEAMRARLISSCHDLSDGGLIVAVAEMCIGGRLGACINLTPVPVRENLSSTEIMYSESASRLLLTVSPDKKEDFEAIMTKFCPKSSYAAIGQVGVQSEKEVGQNNFLTVLDKNRVIFSENVETLALAFKKTLNW